MDGRRALVDSRDWPLYRRDGALALGTPDQLLLGFTVRSRRRGDAGAGGASVAGDRGGRWSDSAVRARPGAAQSRVWCGVEGNRARTAAARPDRWRDDRSRAVFAPEADRGWRAADQVSNPGHADLREAGPVRGLGPAWRAGVAGQSVVRRRSLQGRRGRRPAVLHRIVWSGRLRATGVLVAGGPLTPCARGGDSQQRIRS